MKSTGIAFVILLVACESSEKKAERLRSDQLMACFEANQPNGADQAAHDRDPNYKETPEQRRASVARISVELRAKCDVATRELNKFLKP